jgi:cytochrome c oxidase assembly protein subunit 15
MSTSAIIELLLVGLLVASMPLVWVWARSDTDKYRKLVWVTAFLTFDLIMFGAFTRLTDSGLGCPDWPGCYGQSTPLAAADHIRAAEAAMPSGPVTFTKAWIEMLHRYFAMGVGVLITVLMALAWLHRERTQRSPWPATALFVLVCVQGAFGAWTVTLKLMPVIVTMHLLLGVLLLCALAALAARTEPARIPEDAAAHLRAPAFIVLALVFMQIALGGWVSTNYAVLACADFPLCNGAVVPEADFARGFDLTRPLGMNDDGTLLSMQALVAIHWVHRVFALVVTVAVVWLAARLWRASARVPALRGIGVALLALIGLQVLTGVSNVVFTWPLAVAVIHNGGAAALAALLALLNSRLAVSAPAAAATAGLARAS